MADNRDRFTSGKEGFNQFDRVGVFRQIPHRSMSAGIKDGVEIFLPDAVEANGLAELCFRGRVLFKPDCNVRTKLRLVALGVERRTAAFRRCESERSAGFLE